MFVDIVRAMNDGGDIGFLPWPTRLNVLDSRLQDATFYVANIRTIERPERAVGEWDRREKQHLALQRVIEWYQTNGRDVNVACENLLPYWKDLTGQDISSEANIQG